MTDEAKALVERLRALHVWPQAVADDHADLLAPRQIDKLYEVGRVSHEAADLIETQAREIERLNAILSELNDADVIARTMAENERLRGIVRGWHYLAVGPDEMGDYYTQKALIKASEPYASPALKALAGDSHDQ